MRKRNLSFRPELLKGSISYCTQERCSRKKKCLHYLAYHHSEPFASALFRDPRNQQKGLACSDYLSNEVQRVGRGFRRALDLIPKGQARNFRDDVMLLFDCGQTQFYNYANGRKSLSLEEEKELALIFVKYGVRIQKICDVYEEVYSIS